jgi:hypothetical protein
MLSSIFYNYNDAAPSLVNALTLKTGKLFYPDYSFFHVLKTIDPLTTLFAKFLNGLFYPISAAWIMIAFYSIAVLLVSYFLFVSLTKNRSVSVAGAFIYFMHPSFVYRLFSITPNLYQVFIFPLTLLLLTKKTRPVFLSLVLGLTFYLSSYLAYFSCILVFFWYLGELLTREINIVALIRKVVVFVGILVLMVAVPNLGLVSSNLPIFGKYAAPAAENSGGNVVVYRDMNDFYSFSFRPWYFLIPPKNSLFLGNISQKLHSDISSSGYYLTQNYNEQEMAGSFIGWHFFIVLLGIFYVLYLQKTDTRFKTALLPYKGVITKSIICIVGILAISGPPSFTVSGITLYTPSYLVYYLMPFFRVLTRLSSVIFLLVLLINLVAISTLSVVYSKKYLLLAFLLVLSLVSFSVKLPLVNVSKPPREVKELTTLKCKVFAVIPIGDYYSSFWILHHEKLLINPKDFVNTKTKYNASKLTYSLFTTEGLQAFSKGPSKCLVLYDNALTREFFQQITKYNKRVTNKTELRQYLESSPGLRKVEDFNYINNRSFNDFFTIDQTNIHSSGAIYITTAEDR